MIKYCITTAGSGRTQYHTARGEKLCGLFAQNAAMVPLHNSVGRWALSLKWLQSLQKKGNKWLSCLGTVSDQVRVRVVVSHRDFKKGNTDGWREENAVWNSRPTADLHPVLSHCKWATCLKVCLIPVMRLSQFPQYYRRDNANKEALLIHVQTHFIYHNLNSQWKLPIPPPLFSNWQLLLWSSITGKVM